ncbi:MAG: penicillin-binding protein 1A [Bacteroidota bacterium]
MKKTYPEKVKYFSSQLRKSLPQKIDRKLLIKIMFIAGGGIFSLAVIFFAMVHFGAFGRLPQKEQLKKIHHPQASEVYSADGVLMGQYYLQNRSDIRYESIPPEFVDALIATEDIRFHSHSGIDIRSLGRVAIKSVLLGNDDSGGGSTLTQQLAKNLFPRENFGILSLPVAKIKEMIIARRLEKLYNKEQIIELYLNTVSFGENTYGLKTAAMRYFHKQPNELTLLESAVLVGLLKGTGIYNPNTSYSRSMLRRNVVLGQMKKYGYLEPQYADSIMRLPITLNYYPLTHYSGIAPYFRAFLKKEIDKWLEANPDVDGKKFNLHTDGLRIYTTIDSRMQAYADNAVHKHLAYLQMLFDNHWATRMPWGNSNDLVIQNMQINKNYPQLLAEPYSEHTQKVLNTKKRTKLFTWNGITDTLISPLDSARHHLKMLQAGFIAMEPSTGYIKAWVGGINHQFFKYDHVMARRQTGSVFKPFVYLSALEAGIKPCDFIPNDSVVYEDYDNWVPRNADRDYGGYYSVKGALTHSVNTVSVNLLMKTGINEVINLASRAGITSDLPHVPSLALGTSEVSLLEMVRGYTLFSNNGSYVDPVYILRIEDKEGNVLYNNSRPAIKHQVASMENTQMMVHLMRNVVNQGTAAGLRSQYHLQTDIAGKTGTTQNQSDGWFIGITPDLVAGAWVGGESPMIRFRSLHLGQGSHSAMPVFGRFMQQVYADPKYQQMKYSTFDIPPEITDGIECEDYSEENPDKIFKILKRDGKLDIRRLIEKIFKKKED